MRREAGIVILEMVWKKEPSRQVCSGFEKNQRSILEEPENYSSKGERAILVAAQKQNSHVVRRTVLGITFK